MKNLIISGHEQTKNMKLLIVNKRIKWTGTQFKLLRKSVVSVKPKECFGLIEKKSDGFWK